MPLYESTFIARPDISSQQVDGLAEQFREILTEAGGEIAKTEYWGLRSLAYRIKKNRKGHYYFMNIDAPPEAIDAMERTMRINEDVIRYMNGVRERAPTQTRPPLTQSRRPRPRRPWRPRRTVGRAAAGTMTAKVAAGGGGERAERKDARRLPMQVPRRLASAAPASDAVSVAARAERRRGEERWLKANVTEDGPQPAGASRPGPGGRQPQAASLSADRGHGGPGGGRGGGGGVPMVSFPRRPFFRRKKSCPFSGPNAPKIDYRDVKLLQRFSRSGAKIVPTASRRLGQEAAGARHARSSALAVHLALLPYVIK